LHRSETPAWNRSAPFRRNGSSCSFFSIGSADLGLPFPGAVAPGQIAEMLDHLHRKRNGSSAAAEFLVGDETGLPPSAIIRNRIRVGWLTRPGPKRLKRFHVTLPNFQKPFFPASFASEAKQIHLTKQTSVDCFVASLLAMTRTN